MILKYNMSRIFVNPLIWFLICWYNFWYIDKIFYPLIFLLILWSHFWPLNLVSDLLIWLDLFIYSLIRAFRFWPINQTTNDPQFKISICLLSSDLLVSFLIYWFSFILKLLIGIFNYLSEFWSVFDQLICCYYLISLIVFYLLI